MKKAKRQYFHSSLFDIPRFTKSFQRKRNSSNAMLKIDKNRRNGTTKTKSKKANKKSLEMIFKKKTPGNLRQMNFL